MVKHKRNLDMGFKKVSVHDKFVSLSDFPVL